MNYRRSLPLLVSLIGLTGLAATGVRGATVSVFGSSAVSFDTFYSPVGNERVRVGFFRDYVEAEPDRLRAALAGETPVVQQYLAANFIPLGEPSAPVFANYGISSELLGGASTVSFREFPAGSGHLSIGGVISDITFTANAPANTLTSDGLPLTSRLFLLVYDTPNDPVCRLGVYSASNWLVPSVSTSVSLLLISVNTAAEAFHGTAVSTDGSVTLQLGSLICMPEPGTGALLLLSWGLLNMRGRKSPCLTPRSCEFERQ